MATLTQNVKDVFETCDAVYFATADAQGQPNACIVGLRKVVDDETVYVSDQYFNKTLANLKVNDKVAITFWSKDGAFQIHGTSRYITEGDEEWPAEEAWATAFFEARGSAARAKGGVFIHVDAVYDSMGGPNAGNQIA